MRTVKTHYKGLVYLLIAVFLLSSCVKKDVEAPGVIYLRIISDGGFTSYNDDNDGIPYNFIEGQYYGPCESGTYNYSAKVNGYTWSGKTYTLSKPADGKRRNYSFKFYVDGNGMSASMSHEDVDQ